MNSTDLLLRMLDEAFDHRSWHGPNLRGSLRGLSPQEAAWRPQPGRHNIWELAVHAAYWKYAVRRRLLGEKRGSFPLKGSNWFERPLPGGDGSAQWQADLALLLATHRQLREAVAQLEPDRLSAPLSGGKTGALELIIGIASHDLYHAGQIQLLKRMMTGEAG